MIATEDIFMQINKDLLKQKDKILKLRNDIKEVGRKTKQNFEKDWYLSILFFVGLQWLQYDRTRKEWVDAKLDRWYPKPVTNKYGSSAKALKALLTQQTPRTIISPAGDSEEDLATAEIGDVMVDILDEESGIDQARNEIASWIIQTGNGFYHNFYYVDANLGTTKIPKFQCQTEGCGEIVSADEIENEICPSCSQSGSMIKAVGQDGNEIVDELPKGKLETSCASPFEIFFNAEILDFKKVRQVIRSKSVPTEELKSKYPEFKDKIKPESDSGGNVSETYQKALAYISQSNQAVTKGGADKVESSIIDYMYVLPEGEFKSGVLATVIGEEIVELSTMDVYKNQKGIRFIPIEFIGGEIVPGRFWRKSPLSDIIQKQIQRNKYESFTELQGMAMTGGKWLDPGTNMSEPTGDPNQVIDYDFTIEGRKPEQLKGIPPDTVILQMIEKIDKDIEELTGTYDVLKGQLPKGLDTFSGLRLLTERAFSIHGEMVKNWEIGHQENTKMQLEIARTHFIEIRKKTFKDENGSWETKQFSKADLQGAVDIKVEPGSTIPRSVSVENAAIIDSIKLGLINIQDPDTHFKVLQKLGQSDLESGVGIDIKDAMKEWKEFKDSVEKNPGNPQTWKIRPRFGIDNESVHYRDAVNRAKSDEYFSMPPIAQQIWQEHIAMHKNNMEMEMMKKAQIQQPEKQSVPMEVA